MFFCSSMSTVFCPLCFIKRFGVTSMLKVFFSFLCLDSREKSQPISIPGRTCPKVNIHRNGVCSNGIHANHVNNDGLNREAEGRGSGSHTISGLLLYCHQFHALILKRFYQARRNLKGLLSQIFLPSFFITIAMVFALSAPKLEDFPRLPLNTNMFDRPNYVPHANVNSSNSLAVDMESTLKLPSGIGSFCVVNNTSENLKKWSYNCHKDAVVNNEEIRDIFNKECRRQRDYSGVRLCQNGTIKKSSADRGRQNATGAKCYCSNYRLEYICPFEMLLPSSKEILTATHDTLRNITGRDVSKYLLSTTQATRMARLVYHLVNLSLLR